MTRRRVFKIFGATTVTLTAMVVGCSVYLAHANRQSAIRAATTWARLASLPPSAQHVRVDVTGSMFSREIAITFDAPPAAIAQWLAASPGPSSATRSTVGPVTTYAVAPGGGAVFAEVRVDADSNQVVIRTYWS